MSIIINYIPPLLVTSLCACECVCAVCECVCVCVCGFMSIIVQDQLTRVHNGYTNTLPTWHVHTHTLAHKSRNNKHEGSTIHVHIAIIYIYNMWLRRGSSDFSHWKLSMVLTSLNNETLLKMTNRTAAAAKQYLTAKILWSQLQQAYLHLYYTSVHMHRKLYYSKHVYTCIYCSNSCLPDNYWATRAQRQH